MAELAVDNLSKTYDGGIRAVSGLTLRVADGEMLAVLGPSGCGKTTLLRLIAGLEEPTTGTVSIAGRCVNDVPPHRRDVAMVFQHCALYPHMTVRRNIAFPLRVRGQAASQARPLVAQAAETLRITDLLDRRPGELSAGQMQRVALAKAIVRSPAVMLLDEPFSHLDTDLRLDLRGELKRLCQRRRLTTICVTHNPRDAVALGGRIAVMDGGKLERVTAAKDFHLSRHDA